ncbi:MAG: hypothetical protein ACI80V_001159 [Rhodothermales bacterium]|jgi:hypothetical protein
MIQRVQSVYLILGAAALVASFFVGEIGREAHTVVAWFIPAAGGSLLASSAAATISIFLFGNRRRQRTSIVAAQYVTLASLVVVFLGMYFSGTLPSSRTFALSSWLALVLPLLAFLMLRLARKGVDADIKLIKSVDRLR